MSTILPHGCGEGCAMTWQEYNTIRYPESWVCSSVVVDGVYEHPHLSREVIYEQNGRIREWPINYLVRCSHSAYHLSRGVDILKTIDHVLENGADVNQPSVMNGITPLFRSSGVGVFQHLLNRGADIKVRYDENRTLLHYFVDSHRIGLIQEIMHVPGVVDLIDEKSDGGVTAYDMTDKHNCMKYPIVASFLRGDGVRHKNVKRAR